MEKWRFHGICLSDFGSKTWCGKADKFHYEIWNDPEWFPKRIFVQNAPKVVKSWKISYNMYRCKTPISKSIQKPYCNLAKFHSRLAIISPRKIIAQNPSTMQKTTHQYSLKSQLNSEKINEFLQRISLSSPFVLVIEKSRVGFSFWIVISSISVSWWFILH
jgi:hypothetical protein